jgi:hypothetical protein
MLNDKSISGLSKETYKWFVDETSRIVMKVDQDEHAIEMTKADFRKVRNKLRKTKD